jgi:DNA-binding winged helix-turn-helix (wHTH) protein/tetratricopeptide (TPR) repeat protein
MKPAGSSGEVFRFGLFEADVRQVTLRRSGVRVSIPDQPFRVLIILLQHPSEIVTREELRQRLWPEGTYVDFEGSLNAALKRLRFALGDDAGNPVFVETVPKRGYRFIAPVRAENIAIGPPASRESLGDSSGDGVVPGVEVELSADKKAPDPNQPEGRPTGHLIYVVSVIALVVLTGLGWYLRGDLSRVRTATTKRAVANVPIPRTSVAVLGFHNLSGKADDGWLATAFAEMLSTELAAGEKLRLVSGEDVTNLRLSSPWPTTGTLDPKTTARIGGALNSDLLILGSYTTIGRPDREQLRLDVRLQVAKTGEILSEIAEIGSRQDLFQVVSRISGKLRDRLGVPHPQDLEEAGALASLPSNPEAVRFYSLGLAKLREYDYVSARGLFQEAIKADRKFPLAHSMLSRADIFLGHDDQAKAEAKRGLDLAGGVSRVQKMEIEAGYYHAIADRAKAAGIYRVLFNLFPDSLDYGLQLAKLQLESYHPDEALETIGQLRSLPPPAGDDPGLDYREAIIEVGKDVQAADRLFHSAAAKAQAQGKKLLYARAQMSLCLMNRQHLQTPPECQEAYEIFLAAGNRDGAGACLQLMAEANRQSGHFQEAIPLYERALQMFKDAGNREMTGVTLNNLALVLEKEGLWSRAEKSFRSAKQNFEAVNDKVNTAEAASNIADILVMRGHLREAADIYRESWELVDSSGRGRHEYAHTQHSTLLLMQGELKPARLEIEAQINSLRAYGGDPWQLANAVTVLGDIEKAGGNLDGSGKDYEEALELLKKANAPLASTQVSLAELAVAEGHASAAESLVRQAIAEFEREQSAGDEIGGYTSLSHALVEQGKVTAARDAISHAYKLASLHEFPVLALPLQILWVRATTAAAKPGIGGNSDLAAADREIRAVIQQSHRLGLYTIECNARLALGALETKLNPALGRAQLATLATETRSRGLERLARQAELGNTPAGSVVAANKPAR